MILVCHFGLKNCCKSQIWYCNSSWLIGYNKTIRKNWRNHRRKDGCQSQRGLRPPLATAVIRLSPSGKVSGPTGPDLLHPPQQSPRVGRLR